MPFLTLKREKAPAYRGSRNPNMLCSCETVTWKAAALVNALTIGSERYVERKPNWRQHMHSWDNKKQATQSHNSVLVSYMFKLSTCCLPSLCLREMLQLMPPQFSGTQNLPPLDYWNSEQAGWEPVAPPPSQSSDSTQQRFLQKSNNWIMVLHFHD